MCSKDGIEKNSETYLTHKLSHASRLNKHLFLLYQHRYEAQGKQINYLSYAMN